ncbi:MAG TPA: sigma-70 family RNA polymerase sigma factor [Lacipirellula sp.]
MSISDSTAERYTAHDPDVRLMLRVRDDDAAAFEELMLRYQNRVVSLLAHLTRHQDIAEDLAQDVFLRVYRARKKYVPGAKFSTWLFTIAHNVAANARRTLARRHEVQPAPQPGGGDSGANALEAAAVAASGLMPARQIEKLELRDVVNMAVAALSERQREAVLLNKFEHLSYEEIAEVMQLTPSAVKSLLTRARANLRDVIEPYLQQGVKATGSAGGPPSVG